MLFVRAFASLKARQTLLKVISSLVMTIKETNGGHVIIDSIRYPRDIKNLNKGASPKKKTAKIQTYAKFSSPYVPGKHIWTEINMDIRFLV